MRLHPALVRELFLVHGLKHASARAWFHCPKMNLAIDYAKQQGCQEPIFGLHPIYGHFVFRPIRDEWTVVYLENPPCIKPKPVNTTDTIQLLDHLFNKAGLPPMVH